ncbi:MAG: hypothetical protein OXH75_22060 [Acidobacteria bacterium]|nr:hypothetical protein [Acidobacteriota bacterium]
MALGDLYARWRSAPYNPVAEGMAHQALQTPVDTLGGVLGLLPHAIRSRSQGRKRRRLEQATFDREAQQEENRRQLAASLFGDLGGGDQVTPDQAGVLLGDDELRTAFLDRGQERRRESRERQEQEQEAAAAEATRQRWAPLIEAAGFPPEAAAALAGRGDDAAQIVIENLQPGVDRSGMAAVLEERGASPGELQLWNAGELTTKQLVDLVDDRAQQASAAAAAAAPDPLEGFGETLRLRQEFERQIAPDLQVVQSAQEVQQLAENPSAAGDIALVFRFMKALDPSSVVREGEFAAAAGAAGLPGRLQAAFARVDRGELLTPDQRQDLATQVGVFARGAQNRIDAARVRFGELATGYGFDPTAIVRPTGAPATDDYLSEAEAASYAAQRLAQRGGG